MDELEQPYLTDKQLQRTGIFIVPRDPIYAAANALLAHDYASLDRPKNYLEVLDSRIGPGFNRRLIAAEALRFTQLTPELVEQVEETLREIVSYRHMHPASDFFARAFNVAWKYAAGFFFLMTAFVLVDTFTSEPFVTPYWLLSLTVILSVLLFFAIPAYSVAKDATRYRRLRGACALGLGKWGGPASVGTLIGLSEEGDLWKPARTALRHVLMRLTVEDYGKVSPSGILRLSESFSRPLYPGELDEWVPLILDSLEKVGTGASVEGVLVLAKSGRNEEWREHAQRILPTLMERQRLERDSSRLLRPTTNLDKPDALLRPASLSNRMDDENLLRAVHEDP